jgi:hypothetical protein
VVRLWQLLNVVRTIICKNLKPLHAGFLHFSFYTNLTKTLTGFDFLVFCIRIACLHEELLLVLAFLRGIPSSGINGIPINFMSFFFSPGY